MRLSSRIGRALRILLLTILILCPVVSSACEGAISEQSASAQLIEFVQVARDGRGFVLETSQQPFTPWGFNYDHDAQGRLLEDYWEDEALVRLHLQRIRECGATVVRLHLQVGRFLKTADQLDSSALTRLKQVVRICEELELRIVLTGLGCYRKSDTPAWYDALTESDRWAAQAFFWKGVAAAVADSPAIFCLDLMNEPVVPGSPRSAGDWLGPPFADRYYVQFITLDPRGRSRQEIARQWIDHLVDAVRSVNQRHLITIGLVDWSLDRPGLTSGFIPELTCQRLDFLSVHLYPEADQIGKSLETLRGFAIGKPVVITELFPLKCSIDEADRFVQDSHEIASGWLSFHWGESLTTLSESKSLSDAILAAWIERFSATMKPENASEEPEQLAPDDPELPQAQKEFTASVQTLLDRFLEEAESIPQGDTGGFVALQRVMTAAETLNLEERHSHRAALVVLGIVLGDDAVAKSLEADLQLGSLETREMLRQRITIQGRSDLSRHYWASAGLAITIGSAQAFAIGITKEWQDAATGGSGFSFADLGADRAGIALSRQATRGREQTAAWRLGVQQATDHADLFPPLVDLPEGLDREELENAWGSLTGESFRKQLLEIDRRIANCKLLRAEHVQPE